MNNNCTGIAPNADVSGIGIRVNLYVSTFLGIIPKIPNLTTDLLEAISTTAAISCWALVLSAIVETIMGELSLYHAFFIQEMLAFYLRVLPDLHQAVRLNAPPRLILNASLTYVMWMMFTGWSLYYLATAETFGSSPECNDDVKFIIFFTSFRATSKWVRGVGMAMTIIPGILGIITPLLLIFGKNVKRPEYSSSESSKSSFWKWVTFIWNVVTLELYVHRNRHLIQSADEQSWSFGQIISLLMIMSPLYELILVILKFYPAFMRARKKLKDARKNQRQVEEALDAESSQPENATSGNSGEPDLNNRESGGPNTCVIEGVEVAQKAPKREETVV